MSGARRRHDSVRIAGTARQTARPSSRGGGKGRRAGHGDADHSDAQRKPGVDAGVQLTDERPNGICRLRLWKKRGGELPKHKITSPEVDENNKHRAFRTIENSLFNSGKLSLLNCDAISRLKDFESVAVQISGGRIAQRLINNLHNLPNLNIAILNQAYSAAPLNGNIIRDIVPYILHIKEINDV